MSERPLSLLEALLPLLTLAALLVLCATFLELNGQMLVLVILASAVKKCGGEKKELGEMGRTTRLFLFSTT